MLLNVVLTSRLKTVSNKYLIIFDLSEISGSCRNLQVCRHSEAFSYSTYLFHILPITLKTMAVCYTKIEDTSNKRMFLSKAFNVTGGMYRMFKK